MAVRPLDKTIQQLRQLVYNQHGAELSDAELLERFIGGDQAAFELLTWRHSALVLGVCRRVLQQEPDAEDAFQATFLALVRKAGSISKRESVGSWLYKVAYRNALAIRTAAARHSRREQQAVERRDKNPVQEAAWRELQPTIDAAILELPDRYRVPFLLCCLEGKTLQEVAAQLGCPRATVATRVRRARARLQARLARKGLQFSAAAFTMLFAGQAVRAQVPPRLMAATIHAATELLRGQAAAGLATQTVSAFAPGVVPMLGLKKLLAVAVALIVGIGSGAFALMARSDGPQPAPAAKAPAAATADRLVAVTALEQALQQAAKLPNFEQRVWVPCQIARVQAQAELHDAAAASVRQALRAALESESDHRILDVAECAAQLGDVPAAFTILDALEDPSQRSTGLARVSAAQALRGELSDAAATAARIQNDDTRLGEALTVLCDAQAKRGKFAAALETASRLATSSAKAEAKTRIAVRQFRAGKRTEAAETLQQALESARGLPVPQEKVRQSFDARSSIMAQIAGAHAEFGELAAARKLVVEIDSEIGPEVAWKNIAVAQVARGDSRGALQSAEQIHNESLKSEAFQEIIVGLIRANDLPAAVQLAHSLKQPMPRCYALLEVAHGQVRAGQRQAALETFRQIRQEAEQAKDGKTYGNVKPAILSHLAQAQARAGLTTMAGEWVNRETSELVKIYALLGLAKGILEQQRGAATSHVWHVEDDVAAGRVKVFSAEMPAKETELKRLLERRKRSQAAPKAIAVPSQPLQTFRGKLILFGCSRPGDPSVNRIVALSADGSALESILELKDGQRIMAGRISPDGRYLAFSVSTEQRERYDVWLLDVNGQRRKLTADAMVQAWLPDCKRLACTRGQRNAWVSFLLDIDKGAEERLPLPRVELINDWSPDGQWMAVMAENPDKTFQHPTKGTYPLRGIYLVKPDGSGRTEVKAEPLLDNLWPRFAPDSKRLVYHQRSHEEGRVLHDTIVQGIDGSGAKAVLSFDTFFKGNQQYRANGFPCWSGDGKQVVWLIPRQRTKFSTVKMELVFVPLDKGDVKVLDLNECGLGWAQAIDWR